MFHLYGLLIGIGIVVAVEIIQRIWEKEQIKVSFYPVLATTLISGIIGARIYHLITDGQLYAQASVWEMVAVWNGGIGVIGALIGGILGLTIYLLVNKKIKYSWAILDAVVLGIPFAQAIGRWGNFFNQELYGLPTTLPWGIQIQPGIRFHPLFLYESLLMAGFGLIMWVIYRKRVKQVGQGWYFGYYLIWYSLVRFGLEFL